MSTSSITATIESDVRARGLAIIITNDYHDCTSLRLKRRGLKLSPLPGTFIDGENMKDTFLDLHFVVHWERNINNPQFTKLIHEACNFQDYHKFKKYKCIVFVFSGHGNSRDFVYLQDGSEVSIGEDIIKPFLPKASPNMGKYPKLFFFDACRGEQESESVMVPRSGPTSGGHDNSSTFERRGGSVIERIRVPEEGGFLVAYSTMSNHIAWESKKPGGTWMQKLAEGIRTNTTSSIDDVLTKVNSALIKDPTRSVQQPEKLSRLNDVVYLHPQAPSKVKIAAVFPSPPTSSLDRTNDTPPPHTPSHTNHIQSASSHVTEWEVDNTAVHQLKHCYPSATFQNFKDYPYFPVEYKGVTYYRSTATVTLPDQNSVVGDSREYFVNIQLSREKAIMDALLQLQSPQEAISGASGYSGSSYSPQRQQLEPPALPFQRSAATPGLTQDLSRPSQQGFGNEMSPYAESPRNSSTSTENYTQQVKQFFKENSINPQYEYQSDSMAGSTRYRCIVHYTINGQMKKVDSGHYYSNKPGSREQASKVILSRENVSQDTKD